MSNNEEVSPLTAVSKQGIGSCFGPPPFISDLKNLDVIVVKLVPMYLLVNISTLRITPADTGDSPLSNSISDCII